MDSCAYDGASTWWQCFAQGREPEIKSLFYIYYTIYLLNVKTICLFVHDMSKAIFSSYLKRFPKVFTHPITSMPAGV